MTKSQVRNGWHMPSNGRITKDLREYIAILRGYIQKLETAKQSMGLLADKERADRTIAGHYSHIYELKSRWEAATGRKYAE